MCILTPRSKNDPKIFFFVNNVVDLVDLTCFGTRFGEPFLEKNLSSGLFEALFAWFQILNYNEFLFGDYTGADPYRVTIFLNY
mgnify:CR=1 FL=1